MAKKKNGKRYTEKERARILAVAARDGLTGKQASQKFGVSEVTLWKWRRDAKGMSETRQPSAIRVAANNGSLAALVRAQVQQQVRSLLPGIIREEVARALATK